MRQNISLLILYTILGLVCGLILPFQTVFNSRLASCLPSPSSAALVSFVMGTFALGLSCAIYVLTSHFRGSLEEHWKLNDTEAWMYVGGFVGVAFVMGGFCMPAFSWRVE